MTKTYGGDLKRDDGWTRTALRWGPIGTGALNPEWANANLIFDESVQDELTDTIAGGPGLVEQWSTEFPSTIKRSGTPQCSNSR